MKTHHQTGPLGGVTPGTGMAWRASFVLVALATLLACSNQPKDVAGSPAAAAPAVEALPARAGSLPLEEMLSGVVRARNQVAIRAEISAAVVEVLARNGDAVTVGQALVRLDDEALSEQLRRAEAELRLAEATALEANARVEEIRARVVRTRALAADGVTSQLDLETIEAQLDAVRAGAGQAEARVQQALATVQERRSMLAKATVQAPVAGFVGQRDVEVGMVVNPAATLFLLGDLDDLIVEVPLTQEMLSQVETGSPVEIDVRGGGGDPLRTEISRISPFLEAESFSTTAEIDIIGARSGLRPGMFVSVRVLYGASERATLVPASALWEDPLTGDWTVFVIEDSAGLGEAVASGGEIPETPRKVGRRAVRRIAEGRGRVAVDGVAEGEWVVILGQHLLQESFDALGDQALAARVRPIPWAHVLELESLQREDLLERFLAKQRLVARNFGAELPESPAVVEEALRAGAEQSSGPAPVSRDRGR
jgi:RND family efflux transporter MFP subunit